MNNSRNVEKAQRTSKRIEHLLKDPLAPKTHKRSSKKPLEESRANCTLELLYDHIIQHKCKKVQEEWHLRLQPKEKEETESEEEDKYLFYSSLLSKLSIKLEEWIMVRICTLLQSYTSSLLSPPPSESKTLRETLPLLNEAGEGSEGLLLPSAEERPTEACRGEALSSSSAERVSELWNAILGREERTERLRCVAANPFPLMVKDAFGNVSQFALIDLYDHFKNIQIRQGGDSQSLFDTYFRELLPVAKNQMYRRLLSLDGRRGFRECLAKGRRGDGQDERRNGGRKDSEEDPCAGRRGKIYSGERQCRVVHLEDLAEYLESMECLLGRENVELHVMSSNKDVELSQEEVVFVTNGRGASPLHSSDASSAMSMGPLQSFSDEFWESLDWERVASMEEFCEEKRPRRSRLGYYARLWRALRSSEKHSVVFESVNCVLPSSSVDLYSLVLHVPSLDFLDYTWMDYWEREREERKDGVMDRERKEKGRRASGRGGEMKDQSEDEWSEDSNEDSSDKYYSLRRQVYPITCEQQRQMKLKLEKSLQKEIALEKKRRHHLSRNSQILLSPRWNTFEPISREHSQDNKRAQEHSRSNKWVQEQSESNMRARENVFFSLAEGRSMTLPHNCSDKLRMGLAPKEMNVTRAREISPTTVEEKDVLKNIQKNVDKIFDNRRIFQPHSYSTDVLGLFHWK